MATKPLSVLALALALASSLAVGSSSSVLIMRHCVRSTPTSVHGGAKGFESFDNYTSQPFPGWSVAPYQCLGRGIDLLEAFGAKLKWEFYPQFVISDSPQRDLDTARAVLKGMGSRNAINVKPAIFNPFQNGICSALPLDKSVEYKKEHLEKNPPAADHAKRIKAIQEVLGKGVAPPIEDIPSKVADTGYYSGGDFVGSAFVEAFLMQFGGGLETAWGKLDEAGLYDFLKAHIYYRNIDVRVPEICQRSHSNMVSHIMSSLNGGSQRRTLYVGHDTDLDCLASFFGLSWATDPYPADATTPGSGLLLEKSLSGYIRATVLYSTFETVSDLVLRRAPANFSMTGTNEVSGEQFTNLVESKLVQECIKM